MQLQTLAILGFLLALASFSRFNASKIPAQKETYNVCETPVCIERARLINDSLNISADPCTDFYSYTCGGWMSKHKIPESQSMTSTFSRLEDELHETLRDILGNMTLVGENQNVTDKAAVLYNACVAVPDIEDRRDVVLAIMYASDLDEWPKTRENKNAKGNAQNTTDVLMMAKISDVLSTRMERDSRNPSAHVIELDQLEFSRVGRNQLINQTTNYSKPIIAAYKKVIQVAMKFLKPGLTDGDLAELSEKLLAFEGQLANLTAPPEGRRDWLSLYHRTTIEELERNFSYIPIHALLQKEFCKVNITLAHNETVELVALDYYKKLNEFLQRADADTLFNYVGLRHMLEWAATGSKDFRNASFELLKVKKGVRVNKPRWKLCVAEVKKRMVESVDYIYVKHKFNHEAKKEVEDLVRRIRVAFNESLQTLKWMDEETRAAAVTKLVKIGSKIAYPDWLFNKTYLEGLYKFVPQLPLNASYGEMLYAIRENNWKRQMEKLRRPYDRDADWFFGAAVVDAFYYPNGNEMVFPSGILQGVFYEYGLPRSLNFGAMGTVVGHEMTHGFDDTGSQYDGEGNLKQWWTNETRAEFMKRAECMQYEYGNITDKETNMTLNAKSTVGEDIADNGGLRLAFEAYQTLLKEEYKNIDTRLKSLEHISGNQLFFIANGMISCSKIRPEHLKLMIQYDPHSPDPYRVNVPMLNMEAFSDTFNCPATSAMNPKHRCDLW
ncbi:neprilysin-1-like [Dermacentor variabilis]|uniref:neprilysin-1-like n=1 Tax=Dermacentor variabilis TaxID=34621 RepID=UPI003F5B1499